MSGHYICDSCGHEGGDHDERCRYLRPMKDRWKGNKTRKEIEEERRVSSQLSSKER